jgi:hypothetical protein
MSLFSLSKGATFIAVPSEVYAFGSMYMISGISAAVVSHFPQAF